MKDTKTQILDEAEALFAQKGFSGTSIRAIVDRAGVNIAAVNYHFTNKEGHFLEVIKRRFNEIEKDRFKKLDLHLDKTSGKPTAEGVIRAFLEPLEKSYSTNSQVPKILVRVFTESPDLKGRIIKPVFGKTRERFFNAFCLAMPNLNEKEIQWRFQFVLASMVGLIIFLEEAGSVISQLPENSSFIEKVIQQTLNGIKAG